MKYVALLRGINVGGNSIIKMSSLKGAFEKLGFENVLTYINSGNVIFDSNLELTEITDKIQNGLLKDFKLPVKVVVKSLPQIEKIIKGAPKEWKDKNNLRCYIAFVFESLNEKEIEKEIDLKEGIDFLETGPGVLYMTTRLDGLTKSSFNRLAGKPFYKEMTVRNFNTTKKVLELMQKP